MEIKELFEFTLTKFFNQTQEEVSELLYEADGKLKETASEALIQKFEAKINSLKTTDKEAIREAQEAGYNRAKKEVMTEFEKKLKESQGVASDKMGMELVDEIILKKSTEKPTKPTDDQIKASKLYLDLEEKFKNNKEIADKHQVLTEEFENYKKGIERNNMLTIVKEKASVIFAGLNPILPENAEKANNLKRVFLTELEKYNYVFDNGSVAGIMDGDKRLEDKFGNPVKFEQLVTEKAAAYFDFKKTDAKGSAENKGGAGGGTDYTGKVPQSKEEYVKMVELEKDPNVRIKIMDAWKEASKAQ
jgi:hypothetical protein